MLKGSSGTGKSTVLEAIRWCLFGGVHGVEPWLNTTKAKTKVELTLPGMVVTRSRAPEKLQVQIEDQILTAEAAQAVLISRMGSKAMWNLTSYIMQGERSPLMTAPNSARLELLQEMVFGVVEEETSATPEYYINKIEHELTRVKTLSDAYREKYERDMDEHGSKYKELKEVSDYDWVASDNIYTEIKDNIEDIQKTQRSLTTFQAEHLKQVEAMARYQTLSTRLKTEQDRLGMSQRTMQALHNAQQGRNLELELQVCDEVEELDRLLSPFRNMEGISPTSVAHSVDYSSRLELVTSQLTQGRQHRDLCRLLNLPFDSIAVSAEIQRRQKQLRYYLLQKELEALQVYQKAAQALIKKYHLDTMTSGISLASNREHWKQLQLKVRQEIQNRNMRQQLEERLRKISVRADVETEINRVKQQIDRQPYLAQYQRYLDITAGYVKATQAFQDLFKEWERCALKEYPYCQTVDAITSIERLIQCRRRVSKHMLECPSCHTKVELELESAGAAPKLVILSRNPLEEVEVNRCLEVLQKLRGILTDVSRREASFTELTEQGFTIPTTPPSPSPSMAALTDQLATLHRERSLQEQATSLKQEIAKIPTLDPELSVFEFLVDLDIDNAVDTLSKWESVAPQFEKIQTELQSLADVTIAMSTFRREIKETELRNLQSVTVVNIEILEKEREKIVQMLQYQTQSERIEALQKRIQASNVQIKPEDVEMIRVSLRKMQQDMLEIRRDISQIEAEISSLTAQLELIPTSSPEETAAKIVKFQNLLVALQIQLAEGQLRAEKMEQEKKLKQKHQEIVELAERTQNLIRLKTMIIETTNGSLQDLVNSINYHLNMILPSLFHDSISAKLLLQKELKNSDRKRNQVNLSITHNGTQFDTITPLSGGERDRLSLALTLALACSSTSPMLFLDECMASLDAHWREACTRVIRQYAAHKTVVNICHETVEGHHDNVIDVTLAV